MNLKFPWESIIASCGRIWRSGDGQIVITGWHLDPSLDPEFDPGDSEVVPEMDPITGEILKFTTINYKESKDPNNITPIFSFPFDTLDSDAWTREQAIRMMRVYQGMAIKLSSELDLVRIQLAAYQEDDQ